MGYDLGEGNGKKIIRISLLTKLGGGGSGVRIKNFMLQASNESSPTMDPSNNQDWTNIYDGLHADNQTTQYYTFSNNTAYRNWRIVMEDSYDTTVSPLRNTVYEMEGFTGVP